MDDVLEKIKELIEKKAYKEFREHSSDINEADMASLLEELDIEELLTFFRILPKDMAADVFAYLPIDIQQEMILKFSLGEAAKIIEALDVDDAADLADFARNISSGPEHPVKFAEHPGPGLPPAVG